MIALMAYAAARHAGQSGSSTAFFIVAGALAFIALLIILLRGRQP